MTATALPSTSILIVDDESSIVRLLTAQVDDIARIVTASSAEAAWEILRRLDVDLLITDLRMPGMDGLAFLQRAKEWAPDLPVIVITAFGSIESAVEAMRAGAFDYLTKPVEMKVFRQCVERALAFRRLREENQYLRERLGEADLPEIVGTSPPMTELKRAIREAAASDATILLTGESGTGKGIVARTVHALSGRRGLFVRLNCAALPAELLESELFGHVRGAFTGAAKARKGKFLLADNGTLFLDEIGTMPVSLQAKLLHVLEDGTFTALGADMPVRTSARIIAATNENLEEAIAAGRFRSDLFWRLNVLSLPIPPLRMRQEDIPLLIPGLLARLAAGRIVDVSSEAMTALTSQLWPGNVRELENTLQRALTRFPNAEELPLEAFDARRADADSEFTLKNGLARTERALLTEALRRAGGHKAQAAELLGVSPRMMSYYLDKYPDLELGVRAEQEIQGR
jgi:DNA-binding NtrC family response regulator